MAFVYHNLSEVGGNSHEFGGICRVEKTNKNATSQLRLGLFCFAPAVLALKITKQTGINQRNAISLQVKCYTFSIQLEKLISTLSQHLSALQFFPPHCQLKQELLKVQIKYYSCLTLINFRKNDSPTSLVETLDSVNMWTVNRL